VLGKEHPSTLRTVNNLALSLYRQGKLAMAETISRQALQFQEKVLGKEHPDTLTNTNNLVLFLVHQGKFAEAKAICWETLQLRENIACKQGKFTKTQAMHRRYLSYI